MLTKSAHRAELIRTRQSPLNTWTKLSTWEYTVGPNYVERADKIQMKIAQIAPWVIQDGFADDRCWQQSKDKQERKF